MKPDNQILQSYHIVVSGAAGLRLDIYLSRSKEVADLTRSKIQNLIHAGHVRVNKEPVKPGYRLHEDDVISIEIPPQESSDLVPEKIPFQTIYEDADLLVISKPPGIVVHPSCGHANGTLVHGLLFHCAELSEGTGEARPGIVHRLDKDTSGILVVAKNDITHLELTRQFKERAVEKIYLAIVDGRLAPMSGNINEPIGRHPVNRKKMAVRPEGGRPAATSWQVLEEFTTYTFVQLRLETGRTHQIRVHMAHLGYPITGDVVYGSRRKGFESLGVTRQCLHAYRLAFQHPRTKKTLQLTAPLWEDMEAVLSRLRNDKNNNCTA